MKRIKRIQVRHIFLIAFLVCFIFAATSCSLAVRTLINLQDSALSSAAEKDPGGINTAENGAQGAAVEAYEVFEMFDLSFTVPADLEIFTLVGAEKTIHTRFETGSDGSEISWLSISPMRPAQDDASGGNYFESDQNGTPILTPQSVTGKYSWETEVLTVFQADTLSVGGAPAAFIEVELFSDRFPDEMWQVRLTRVIYDGIAYDFLYAAFPDRFDEYLTDAQEIIHSSQWKTADRFHDIAFWDIYLRYGENDVTASVSDDKVSLYYNRSRDNTPRFYVKHDDSVLYTDALLDNPAQLDRLLRIWSYDLTDQRFRKYMNPQEVLREQAEVNGKRAVRAVFHNEWQSNDSYLELLLFVHNYDLYILQGKIELGHEDTMASFLQPIIDSIVFEKTVSEPPAGRPMPYSNTVKWMTDTYAILTIRNGADTDLVGGFLPDEEHKRLVKQALLDSWGIADRESSDEVIDRLCQNGHRAQFQEFARQHPIYQLDPDQFEEALKALPDSSQRLGYIYENTYEAYRLRGDNAILAWDYCRIIYLYCSGYIAGYYTYGEALDLSLAVALELQTLYTSWGDMYRDYLAGYHFWSPGDANNPSTENYSRTQILLDLEANGTLLPWDMELTADWNVVFH